jgi:hypothetical protein
MKGNEQKVSRRQPLEEQNRKAFNFKIPSRKLIYLTIAILVALSALIAIYIISSDVPEGPPSVRIQSNREQIDWILGKNRWEGETTNQNVTFKTILAETSVEKLPHVKNGRIVVIRFRGNTPESVTLTEYILKEDGEERFNIPGMEYTVTLDQVHNRAAFTITTNWATALSSNSADYLPGNTLKGYRLECAWGQNSCEYLFIIRGDGDNCGTC